MAEVEHVGVLIVGAGLSGIGAACHLRAACPERSFAVLEAREVSGGTWDLFRYPGVRSDSDMFTLGYSFQPWTGPKAIADGGSILEYLRQTARQHGIEPAIRYQHRVLRASWSTPQARWTVTVQRLDTGQTVLLTCNFLYGNTGYYRYDEGHQPRFPGAERFTGQIVHPQHWPAGLDPAGLRIVVIGSGATAVTLVPALAGQAAHVTMLQRSPSYVLSMAARDQVADWAQRRLPARAAAGLLRWKNALLTGLNYRLSRRAPQFMAGLLRRGAISQLPAGYPVDVHFAPRYPPWDQRLCVSPDGDLFRAIRHGTVTVVTDEIETFTEHGLRLASGAQLEADLIVTATGLNLLLVGGISLAVDGRAIELSDVVDYKGLMFSGVPNFATTTGYTNLSWTLKADLTATYVCRLLNFMARRGYRQCLPLAPDPAAPTEPLLGLTSGYVTRSLGQLPRRSSRRPWRLAGTYPRDLRTLRYGRLRDAGIRFSR